MKARLLKTAAKGLVIGASVLAFAGAAGATTNFTIYGASAQFNFWNGAASAFLQSLGCTAASITQYTATNDSNSKITVATNCPSTLANDNGDGIYTINFSYSSKASYDGIDSVLGVWDSSNNGGAAKPCDPTNTICCSAVSGYYYQRPVATAGGGMACETINIGTSDVDAGSFSQASNGLQFGPLQGPMTNRAFTQANGNAGISVSKLNTTEAGMPNPQEPIAYPFGFFVNNGVTSTRCTTASAANIDNFCLSDSDCGESNTTSYCVSHICNATTSPTNKGGNCESETDCGGTNSYNYCKAQTIDNITRLQVAALYSGGVAYWDDFGVYFKHSPNPLPVTLCMRHAGSGTHATLDLGIVEGNGWGTGIVQNASTAGNGNTPAYWYFNDGTSDLANCMAWAGGTSFAGKSPGYSTTAGDLVNLDSTAIGGAIGYMDADHAAPSNSVGPIKFNGVYPTRVTVHDGIYDNFWTVNRMYAANSLSTVQQTIYQKLITFMSNPANLTDKILGSTRGETYGVFGELNYQKTSDTAYPYVYTGPAATPADPD